MMLQMYMFGYNNRVAVTLFLLIVTAFAGAGMQRLQVDTSMDSLIPADDPSRLVYQKVMGEFGTDNKTIIYIKDKDLWTPEKLTRIEQLHLAIEKIDGVSRVDSMFSLHTIHGVDGKIISRPVLREAPKTKQEALSAKKRALANPLYLGNYFSNDGEVTAMIVSVMDAGDKNNSSRFIYQALKEKIEVHRAEFERMVQVGPPRINAELKQSLYEDFILLGPLSAVILVLSILIFMRSWLSAIVPLVTSLLTIIWTFGMLGWIGIPLNILSAMIPSLIIVIGSTEDTHMMAAFLRGLDENAGKNSRKAAVKYMARHIGLPLILTVLTTSLGFASNLFSNIGLIQQFSFAATFAMLTNGFITVLVMPLMLSLFGPNKNTSLVKDKETNSLPDRVMKIFRYSQDRFPISTLVVTAMLCAFSIFQASKLYVTNDPLSYFPSDRPLIQDTKRIHEDLAGIKIFFYFTRVQTGKGISVSEKYSKTGRHTAFP